MKKFIVGFIAIIIAGIIVVSFPLMILITSV